MTRTIFALATAPGRGAVAVIRLSGPATVETLAALAGGVPAPRRASLRTLRDAAGETLDRALVLMFPAPKSYTGEDCAELHLHGGPAVIDAVTAALAAAGLRPAEAGEFTRRAFENGKLDLGQAEAIADLIDAQSVAQARQAIGQLEGALGRRYEGWRAALIEAMAHLEAAVDFPVEQLPVDVAARARPGLEAVARDLAAALADEARGRRVREGYRVALIGATNAGKSSLLNALAGRDAAIVNDIAGATRDIIEVPLTLAGYRVLLADTAGMRQTGDPTEAEGVRRARAWAADADLRLWVIDGSAGEGAWREAADLTRAGDLALLHKADLAQGDDAVPARSRAAARGLEVVATSTGDADRDRLLAALTARMLRDVAGNEFPAATRLRHEGHLEAAAAAVGRALGALAAPELAAEDVRLAARALAAVTGRFGAEEVLGQVFATFCIGK
ncbi:MAG: tRNA uridine-5-carboxymethylaminomethyl(34) synthesis GTPase MnmE [Caulobacteraceae bacterium]